MNQTLLSSKALKTSGFLQIGRVSVSVPYRMPGNVIEHLEMEFEVYQKGADFKAVPLVKDTQQRLVNLPPSLQFKVKGNKTYSKNDSYKYIAVEIYKKLNKENKVLGSPPDKRPRFKVFPV